MRKNSVIYKIFYVAFPIILYLLIKSLIVNIFVGAVSYGISSKMVIGGVDLSTIVTKDQLNEFISSISYYATLINVIIIVPIFTIIYRRDCSKNSKKIKPVKLDMKIIAMIILLSVASNIALNNVISISGIIQQSQSYQSVGQSIYGTGFIFQVIGTVILGPIAEELIFRGVFFGRLRKLFGFVPSAIISAFTFGLLHGNIVQFVYAFVLGLIFALLMEKYSTIKAPILAHFAANLLSIISVQTKCFNWIYNNITVFIVVTLVCSTVTAFLIGRLDRT